MKAEIHPEYQEATVKCVCGNTWQTRSTVGDIHVDICSACHPFFTGKQKLIDTAGRVERFRRRYAGVEAKKKETAEKAAQEAATAERAEAAKAPKGAAVADKPKPARAKSPRPEAAEPRAKKPEISPDDVPTEEMEPVKNEPATPEPSDAGTSSKTKDS